MICQVLEDKKETAELNLPFAVRRSGLIRD
jgi:hypothetical protein